jgi:Vitamin K epoxide reductase family
MTASKSSRARQARAQAQRREALARNGTAAPNGGAARNGGAAKGGTAVKASTAAKPGTAVKASTAARAGNGAKAGPVVQASTPARGVATRGGVDRRGPRAPAGEASAALEAPAGTAVPVWFQLVTWFLSLAGLGVSIYLTIAHFTESKLAGCSESGLVNCTKVTTSAQSYVFGIPVAVLGLAFFVVALGPPRGRPGPARVGGGRDGLRALPAVRRAVHHREHLPVLHQRARDHVPVVRADRLRRGGLGPARAQPRLSDPA